MSNLHEQLDLAMDMSNHPPGERRSAVAVAASGEMYRGAEYKSQTNLLNFTAEQVALMMAVQHMDYEIRYMVAMSERDGPYEISPINILVMADFARRTPRTFEWSEIGVDEEPRLQIGNVYEGIPSYMPSIVPLEIVSGVLNSGSSPRPNTGRRIETLPEDLRRHALQGMERAFTTKDKATKYGAAVLTASGEIFFSGQYSSFEGRTNAHAEMGAILAARMEGQTEITDIGVVSSKFEDTPVSMCGCCLQFASEESVGDLGLSVYTFCSATDRPEYRHRKIEELLPDQWSSKHGRSS